VFTPAARAYLAAFEAYLKANRGSRVDQLVVDLKAAALEHLLAQPRVPHRTRPARRKETTREPAAPRRR
jgi:plasmid stabilization system protein ParE